MYCQPPRALGLIVGSILVLWSVSVAFLLLNAGISLQGGLLGFFAYAGGVASLMLAVVFASWTCALATLAYSLDRNGLVIAWGSLRQVIPLHAIERLVPGSSVGVPHVRGISWWGHYIGSAEVARIGSVLFYSTHQAAEQLLYVVTNERAYAISVADPAAFAQEVQTRQDLGPTAAITHRVERAGPLFQTVLVDPWARWLAVGAVVACALVWAQIAVRYPSLPPALTLPWPHTSQSAVITVTAREAILELPGTATLLLTVNLALGVLAHAWDRMAGYLVLGAAVAVQVVIFVAILLALD